MDVCSSCCTEQCCDADIETLHRITYASRGAPVSFTGWQTYDHRLRPWYVQQKTSWQSNISQQTTGWSEFYSFFTTTAGEHGLTATGALLNENGAFVGVAGVDYALRAVEVALNRSLHQQQEMWAYVVERGPRSSGLLVANSIGVSLLSNTTTRARLAAVDVSHTGIAGSAQQLGSMGWPDNTEVTGTAGSSIWVAETSV